MRLTGFVAVALGLLLLGGCSPGKFNTAKAKPVPGTFHSRASAIARRYAYVVLQSPVRPSIDAGRVGWVFRPLDELAMRESAGLLIGQHDFSSFRASECQARTPVK